MPVVRSLLTVLGPLAMVGACGGNEFASGGADASAGSTGTSGAAGVGVAGSAGASGGSAGSGVGGNPSGGVGGRSGSGGEGGGIGTDGSTGTGGVAAGGASGGAAGTSSSDASAVDAAPHAEGCSDGERELFLDGALFPDVAGCSGGWSVPGVTSNTSLSPQCNREGGDDGGNTAGVGCSVEDLCAEGWHVCVSAAEVVARGVTECDSTGDSPAIWITRQGSGSGFPSECVDNGTNNLVGCGPPLVDGGYPDPPPSCAPLNSIWIWRDCEAVGVWSCNLTSAEPTVVTKSGPEFGGVLCCRE